MRITGLVGMTALVLLGGCGNKKLDRNTAEGQLAEVVKSGTEREKVSLCPARILNTLTSKGQQRYPCPMAFQSTNKMYDVLVTKHGVFTAKPLIGNQRYSNNLIELGPRIKQNKDLRNLIHIIPNTNTDVLVKMYDYRFGEVTGIRQNSDGSNVSRNCTAIVEYKYEFFNKSPWADDYIEAMDRADIGRSKTYSACFRRYDDGWRLVK